MGLEPFCPFSFVYVGEGLLTTAGVGGGNHHLDGGGGDQFSRPKEGSHLHVQNTQRQFQVEVQSEELALAHRRLALTVPAQGIGGQSQVPA